MFYTKNYQSQFLAKTWQKALRQREIEKNNFHATGDIKKAKAFVKMVNNFTFKTDFSKLGEQIIFSSESLVIPLLPVYAWI
jgi:hypothetical protein